MLTCPRRSDRQRRGLDRLATRSSRFRGRSPLPAVPTTNPLQQELPALLRISFRVAACRAHSSAMTFDFGARCWLAFQMTRSDLNSGRQRQRKPKRELPDGFKRKLPGPPRPNRLKSDGRSPGLRVQAVPILPGVMPVVHSGRSPLTVAGAAADSVADGFTSPRSLFILGVLSKLRKPSLCLIPNRTCSVKAGDGV